VTGLLETLARAQRTVRADAQVMMYAGRIAASGTEGLAGRFTHRAVLRAAPTVLLLVVFTLDSSRAPPETLTVDDYQLLCLCADRQSYARRKNVPCADREPPGPT